jgi:hypothetical protein
VLKDGLSLISSQLVVAIFAFTLTISTRWGLSIALQDLLGMYAPGNAETERTFTLLSRHGLQAVVTCLRCLDSSFADGMVYNTVHSEVDGEI